MNEKQNEKQLEEPEMTSEIEEGVDKERKFWAALADAGSGWTLEIERLLPRFCEGHLTTIEVRPEEVIDKEYIRDLCGGKRLMATLRNARGAYVGRYRFTFPDPPRDGDGNIMQNPESQQNPTFGPGAVMGVFTEFIRSQNAQFQETLSFFQKRVDQIERKSAPTTAIQSVPVIEQKSSLEQLRELAQTMREMEELRADLGWVDQSGQGEVDFLKKTMSDFFQLHLQKEKLKLEKMQNQQPVKIPELPDRKTESENLTIDKISDEELAIQLHKRVESMDPEQLNRVMSIFMGQYAELEETMIDDEKQNVDLRNITPLSSKGEQGSRRRGRPPKNVSSLANDPPDKNP